MVVIVVFAAPGRTDAEQKRRGKRPRGGERTKGRRTWGFGINASAEKGRDRPSRETQTHPSSSLWSMEVVAVGSHGGWEKPNV